MKLALLKSEALLLLVAIIWGFAFVAQRAGMDFVGPFTFNAVRFALGGLVLLPFIRKPGPGLRVSLVLGGGLAGGALFLGSSLQQIGIVYTTAGKAGFITGLYVVLVPILGLARAQRASSVTWAGALLSAAGLYLLCVDESMSINVGDVLVFIGSFFWALHVHVIASLSRRIAAGRLAFFQYTACAALSYVAALLIEEISVLSIFDAAIPILYGGLFSIGIGYTLQVIGQRQVPPAHAAIILSLEAVFAVLGGWLLLAETLPLRGLAGCALMLCGMILSQLDFRGSRKRVVEEIHPS